MLRIPSFRQSGDTTIYQDDAVWTRFYLVPSVPTIRRDSNGRPIFLLTKFATSDQTRAANPNAPRGGGYMNFDVQFAVSDDAVAAAKTELQQWIEQEYTRRKADPHYAGSADTPARPLRAWRLPSRCSRAAPCRCTPRSRTCSCPDASPTGPPRW